ncbi:MULTISPECIES: class I adenylate-forming enzyme family protein [Actinokineospora]|uniref:Acyl-CoA synthetase n=1 Tax=Actinokineospora fastidiosa TaxID=1816 RepID=A0A918GU34_9PSEU|nr:MULTISPECIES: AMP-binding protein [Actinokineospora]UVS81453.1 Benzoate--CoA ligase [Actinokineospora sp. UTMC 2448]GGS58021.1 acyl-CoA synthetase [Actinokineospora fastidiosa]
MRSWWGAELIDHRPDDAVWAVAHHPVTVGRLRAETQALARLFRVQGVRAGTTVALHGRPSLTQLWALFALWSLGAQVVQLEPGVGAADRRALLALCAPQYLVTFGAPGTGFVAECSVLVRRLPGGRPARSSHCVVQFSSGTTGRPKVVGRTSESLLVELDRWRALAGGPAEGETVAVLESTAHSFGLIGGLLHALDVGATVMFPPCPVSAAHAVLGSPRLLAGLLAADLPRLRLAVSSGEPLPADTHAAFLARFGVRVGQAYGTTETGVIAADLAGVFGPPTVGVPVPGVRTRVVGGVLEVHVPQSPYLDQDEPWTGGWMSTQDLVAVDQATGALRLLGRATTPALAEIEAALRAHRHVTDAVVFDGEPIEAHVAATEDIEPGELRRWCLRLLGADRTVPARYHVVGELPRTANGKLMRDRRQILHQRGA